MNKMKFAANLALLFAAETPAIIQRYELAKMAGFKGVELPFPYDIPVEDIVAAKSAAGVEQVLFNAYPGQLSKGDLGLAIHANRQDEFKETLELSVKYLKALDCKLLHIMSGKMQTNDNQSELRSVYVKNLRYAAERLQKDGITALIEPCNSKWVPNYYMNDYDKALAVIGEVSHPNLKLQFDVFHAQIIQGNLTDCIKRCMPHIGHIQIAQVPDRTGPFSAGEINYDYILHLFEELGYDGWFGLEYIPKGPTVDGLKFLQNWK